MLNCVGKLRLYVWGALFAAAAFSSGGCGSQPDNIMIVGEEAEEKQKEKLTEGQKKVLPGREIPVGVGH